ncbi:hypothetical protein C8R43DRAFT_963054 [Mycena crocata]|nr:hypothetical protein C8R43DRAFT_965158 [Mycena crocata]KAJ7108032.1 hypothetical protein C8R43DRAFT_963054 [Mycena crocata]
MLKQGMSTATANKRALTSVLQDINKNHTHANLVLAVCVWSGVDPRLAWKGSIPTKVPKVPKQRLNTVLGQMMGSIELESSSKIRPDPAMSVCHTTAEDAWDSHYGFDNGEFEEDSNTAEFFSMAMGLSEKINDRDMEKTRHWTVVAGFLAFAYERPTRSAIASRYDRPTRLANRKTRWFQFLLRWTLQRYERNGYKAIERSDARWSPSSGRRSTLAG